MIKNKDALLRNGSFIAGRKVVLDILEAGLRAVEPRTVVMEKISLESGKLRVSDKAFDLGSYDNVYVIGFGKASESMAEGIGHILKDKISNGAVIVKGGEKASVGSIRILPAEHPIPGRKNIKAAEEVVKVAKNATERDLILCLVSGGGSALFCYPAKGISLSEMQKINSLLIESGAEIKEINAVRKHISYVKGGRLAEVAYPATIISVIISDVVGNHVGTIASGPTAPDPSTFKDCLLVLEKYGLWGGCPGGIKEYIQKGLRGRVPETPKRGNRIFDRVHNFILADNMCALESASDRAKALGFKPSIVSDSIRDDARFAGLQHCEMIESLKRRVCLISGGECVVAVKGKGKGGPNQEFVLSMVEGIREERVVVAAIDTDGIDGFTDVAGALADGDTFRRASGMNPQKYLGENDSYRFFKKLGDLIETGETGTNVNDLRVALLL